jgi:hypothetical protein
MTDIHNYSTQQQGATRERRRTYSAEALLLAHKARVMTFYLVPQEKSLSLRQHIDEVVKYAGEVFAEELQPQDAAGAMEIIIDKFGGKPGEKTPSPGVPARALR